MSIKSLDYAIIDLAGDTIAMLAYLPIASPRPLLPPSRSREVAEMTNATVHSLSRATWVWFQDRTKAEVAPGYHLLSPAGVTALLALLRHHKAETRA